MHSTEQSAGVCTVVFCILCDFFLVLQNGKFKSSVVFNFALMELKDVPVYFEVRIRAIG